MSKEKLPNHTTEDSKEMNNGKPKKKEALRDHTDEELDDMGWDKESELWGKALVDGINDPENHGKSN